jgi:Ca2+-binding EF-hand superfamily protein
MKNILKKSSVLAAAMLLGASFVSNALAADGEKKADKPKKDRFTQADANGDGKVTFEEFKALAAKGKKEPKPTDEQIEKQFKHLDKDSNKELSKEEMAAGHGKKGGDKPGKGGDKPGKGEKKPKSE